MTRQEKKSIIPDASTFSQAAEVFVEARSTLGPTCKLRTHEERITYDTSGDRPYVNFFNQTAYKVLTPLGAHALDLTIRRHCCTTGQKLHPPPQELFLQIMTIMATHKKEQAEPHCQICGDLLHEKANCPSRNLYNATTDTKRNNATKKADGIATKPTVVKAGQVVCQVFMRKNGACNYKQCQFSHRCPHCNKKSTHTKTCSRP